MNKRSISLNIFLVVSLFIAIAVSKVFIPEGTNFTGTNTNMYSYIAYLTEDIILLFATVVYMRNYFNYKKINKLAFIYLTIYFYAAMVSFYSANIVTSLHSSLRGILYVFIGLLFIEYIKNGDTYKKIIYSIHLFFVIGIIASTIEITRMISFTHVMNFGLGASFYALIGLFSIYFQIDYLKKIRFSKNIFKFTYLLLIIFISLYIVIRMNSLSSILCFIFAYLLALILTKQFKTFLIFLSISLVTLSFIYQLLENGEIRIANKNLDTILEGSGRIHVYKYCSEKIIQGKIDPFGTGFLLDRKLLEDSKGLVVAHSCHSSPLTMVVGLGYIGVVFYFSYIFFLLNIVFFTYGSKTFVFFTKFALISMILFGLGSALYPGAATLLLPITLIIYFLNQKNKKGLMIEKK